MRQPCVMAAALVCGVVCAAEPARAQQNATESVPAISTPTATDPDAPAPLPPREWFGSGRSWWSWSRMTGDWGRVRTGLEDRGLSFQLTATSDGSGLTSRTRPIDRMGRYLTTAGLMLDLEKATGLKGTRALVQYQAYGGANGALRANVVQALSNIDADAFSQFAEVWIEQQIGSRVRVKAGLIDANTEFAFVENGADFIHSSMGLSPTVFPMPTYPDPHMGLIAHVDAIANSYAAAGVFNGGPALGVDDFHSLFALGEAGLRWKRAGGGRVGVGYWRIGGDTPAVDDPARATSTGGEYLVFDQTIWTSTRADANRSLGAFFQAGLADARWSPASAHIGGGLVGRGLVGGRPADTIGLGVTAVRLGGTPPDSKAAHELAIVAFHRFALTPWVGLRPDMQWVKSPGGQTGRSIFAATIRIEVAF